MSHLHPGDGGAGTAPRRRSARLRSQIYASDEGSGLARPRTTRPHPQIDVNEDGAQVAIQHRSSKRRSSQIQASQGGDRVTRRRLRRGTLPDSEDMLREILVRLPLDLYSLPRATAVCKSRRGILVDPKFLRRFYAHHRKPPLLGFFFTDTQCQRIIKFTPILAHTPHLIPPERFYPGQGYSNSKVLDCRHGRVLVKDSVREELVVCDPVTNKQHRVSIPPKFKQGYFKAAVLCAARDQNHVHGACHSSPFKVVLVSVDLYIQDTLIIARVYSSQTHTWGNVIRAEVSDDPYPRSRSTLIGNALYWPANRMGSSILEFDLGTQNRMV